MNKLQLSKKLHDLRKSVIGKRFEEAGEVFKEIESVKAQLRALERE